MDTEQIVSHCRVPFALLMAVVFLVVNRIFIVPLRTFLSLLATIVLCTVVCFFCSGELAAILAFYWSTGLFIIATIAIGETA